MNSDVRDTEEYTLSLKEDIKIGKFKELENAVTFSLSTHEQRIGGRLCFPPSSGVSSFECVVSPRDHDTHVGLHFKFDLCLPITHIYLSAVVSVLNVDGHPKFLRSLQAEETFMVRGRIPHLSCPEFVERRLLLNDEEENLPEGVLTIRCEIDIRCQLGEYYTFQWALSKKYLKFKEHKERGYWSALNLKSSIYPSLCEESPYFKDILDIFQSEDRWHYISDNSDTFADMLYFVENKKLDHVTNSSSLIRLHELACKYDMRNLTNRCRMLMVDTMKPDFAAKALFQAYKYLDKELKDACFDYVNSLSEDERLFVKRELEAGNGEHIIAELFRVDKRCC